MKKTNKIVLGSALSIAMCASLIAGSTFALFTSESKTNIAVTSGKVDVTATVDNLVGHSLDAPEIAESVGKFTNGGTFSYADGTLTLDLITPGDGVSFDLVITNNSTVSIKYQVQMQASNSNFAGDNGLTVTVDGKTAAVNGITYASDWADVVAAAGTGVELRRLPVTVELPEAAGNLYQDKSCEIKIAVLAYQGNAKTENPDSAAISLYNMADFKAFAKSVNAGTDYRGQTIKLMADVDFNAPEATHAISLSYMLADALEDTADAWTPIGTEGNPFRGIFDGKGHTIYNLHVANEHASLFGYVSGATIEHLKFVDVVREEGAGGILVGNVVAGEKTTITDVTVALAEDTTIEEGAANGGLVGEANNDDLTIKDTTVESSDNSEHVWDDKGEEEDKKLKQNLGEGFDLFEITKGEETKDVYEVSSEEGVNSFARTVSISNTYSGKTVELVTDLDMTGKIWPAIGYFTGTFDGNDKTISNLTLDQVDSSQGKDFTATGLFGYVGHIGVDGIAVIQNLRIHNVKVESNAMNVGIIAGVPGKESTFKNIQITGSISVKGTNPEGQVGGILGGPRGGVRLTKPIVFENCKITGEGEGNIIQGNSNCVGGLVGNVGSAKKMTVSSCSLSNITVEGKECVGGVIGQYSSVNATSIIDTELSEVTVRGENTVGGLMGKNAKAKITFAGDTLTNVTVEQIGEGIAEGDVFFGAIMGDHAFWREASILGVTADVKLNLLQNFKEDEDFETWEAKVENKSLHEVGELSNTGFARRGVAFTWLCVGVAHWGVTYDLADGIYSNVQLNENGNPLVFTSTEEQYQGLKTTITVTLTVVGGAATTYVNGVQSEAALR